MQSGKMGSAPAPKEPSMVELPSTGSTTLDLIIVGFLLVSLGLIICTQIGGE